MKVFEIILESYIDGYLTREIQYVSIDNNSFEYVVNNFSFYCIEAEKNLVSVRELLTITKHINIASKETEKWMN